MGFNVAYRCPSGAKVVENISPTGDNFQLLSLQEGASTTLAEVLYPECTNFEGRKLLVYLKEDLQGFDLTLASKLDPHFSEHRGLSPVARFEPSERGLKMANLFCQALDLVLANKKDSVFLEK